MSLPGMTKTQADRRYAALDAKGGSDRNTVALRYFRSRLAQVDSVPCNIAVVPADSLSGGEGASSLTKRWTDLLRDQLRAAFPSGAVGGYGMLKPQGYLATTWSPAYTTYIALSGGAAYGGSQYGFAGCAQLTATGHTVTLTSSALPLAVQNATSVGIMYLSGAGSGTFTVSVDGGADSAAQGSTTGPLAISEYRVTGLSVAPHTVAVKWGGTGNCVIAGFVLYNGDEARGIRMFNGGVGGQKLSGWMATSPLHHWEDTIAWIDPALSIVAIGANEFKTAYNTAGMDPATYRQNLVDAVAAIRAKAPKTSILFVIEHALGGVTVQYPWADYVAASYSVANADGKIAVVDMENRLGPNPNTNIPGILATSDNGQHMTDAGQKFWANAIFEFLTSGMSLSSTQIRATSSARPSTIPSDQALAKTFRADRSAYNITPSSLKRARAAAAAAFAGTGRLDISCLGTSLVAGTGAATKVGSWPSQLQKMLVAQGYPDGGSGFIAAQSNNSATTDPRVTLGAGWSAFAAPQSPALKATSATALTFADTKPSTIVDVWYLDYTTFGFSWTIDGSAQTDIATTNDLGLKKVTISGLSSANHTVAITPKTGVSSGTPMYVMGVSFRNATGVTVHNLGIGGLQTSTIASGQTQHPKGLSLALGPQLTFVQVGANDGITSGALTNTAYSTQIQTVITDHKAIGSDVVLIGEGPAGVTTRPNGPGLQEYPPLYTLADSNDLALIDLYDRMISWTSLDALGMGFSDSNQVHFSAAGYADNSRAILEGLGL